jgi:hypothetical protein
MRQATSLGATRQATSRGEMRHWCLAQHAASATPQAHTLQHSKISLQGNAPYPFQVGNRARATAWPYAPACTEVQAMTHQHSFRKRLSSGGSWKVSLWCDTLRELTYDATPEAMWCGAIVERFGYRLQKDMIVSITPYDPKRQPHAKPKKNDDDDCIDQTA